MANTKKPQNEGANRATMSKAPKLTFHISNPASYAHNLIACLPFTKLLSALLNRLHHE